MKATDNIVYIVLVIRMVPNVVKLHTFRFCSCTSKRVQLSLDNISHLTLLEAQETFVINTVANERYLISV